MIAPHGSANLQPLYVASESHRSELRAQAERLPSLIVSSAAAAHAVMLGAGYFNPLGGFMNVADALSVADNLHTTRGVFWPIPILNVVKDASAIRGANTIALRDPNLPGNPPFCIVDVEAIEQLGDAQLQTITERVFRTLDPEHPGVAAFTGVGRTVISGPIRVLDYSYFPHEFPDTFRTASEIRQAIADAGWKSTVAFQTRNPMHRAHEELCRMAQQELHADGILIHMLLGRLKAGDIPAKVRDAAIRKMVEVYFPQGSVLIAGYGFDMMYAGPREAVLHAIIRQNAGCTHLIVGRDHAGVGNYYGPFDAQTIFDTEVPKDALKIAIYRADNTAWSKKLGRVVMMRDAPDHTANDFIALSGTKVRDLLAAGAPLPPEFSRPEVAAILREYYQSTAT